MKRYRISVDIGGTFTDIVCYDKINEVYYSDKVLTTLHNLAEGVVAGISKNVKDFSEIDYFVHGTTSGLNAFLERKGSKVALIVTEGFKDVYEIGRANRPDIYDIKYKRPKRLIERKDVFELPERVMADGSVEKTLDMDKLESLVNEIKNNGYESIAVCLLHSYKNPVHEKTIKAYLEKTVPEMSISISSDIAREWREYERVSTTVINAYIAPIVKKYLTTLEETLQVKGYENKIFIMQSNGGVMTAKIAMGLPLQTLLSGPVGGTIGCKNLTNVLDNKNLICVDMGGTSFDVSLIVDGELDITPETYLEGFPILSPMINLHTVGAGGGSIAWLEGMGLRVGPQSAGSKPGPACYSQGGTEPTVTDANLVLGRMDEDSFKDNDIKLNRANAVHAVKSIADKINLSVEETAEGIIEIANAKMADAIRTLTIKKGIDPREFVLVAFGGAGPMHAVEIAKHLDIQQVMVPTVSGTFSAGGMLKTDVRYDLVRNFIMTIDEVDNQSMEAIFTEMETEVQKILKEQSMKNEEMSYERSIDMRYTGQEYTVNVPFAYSKVTDANLEKIAELFHEMYLDRYGHNNTEETIEVVNLRISGYGILEKVKDKELTITANGALHSDAVRKVIWNNENLDTQIIPMSDMEYGHKVMGPVIIQDKSSTLVVPPRHEASMDKLGNILIINEDLNN